MTTCMESSPLLIESYSRVSTLPLCIVGVWRKRGPWGVIFRVIMPRELTGGLSVIKNVFDMQSREHGTNQ